MELYGKTLPKQDRQLSLFPAAEVSQEVRAVEGQIQVQVVDTPEILGELVSRMQDAHILSIDTETTSTDQMAAKLVGISLAMQKGTSYYIPVGHTVGSRDQLS